MPAIADNALVKAAALIERLAEFSPEPRPYLEVVALFEAVTASRPPTPPRSSISHERSIRSRSSSSSRWSE